MTNSTIKHNYFVTYFKIIYALLCYRAYRRIKDTDMRFIFHLDLVVTVRRQSGRVHVPALAHALHINYRALSVIEHTLNWPLINYIQ